MTNTSHAGELFFFFLFPRGEILCSQDLGIVTVQVAFSSIKEVRATLMEKCVPGMGWHPSQRRDYIPVTTINHQLKHTNS